ncbi:unnamed protein product [Nippostrongylus brasiliensis]|uniref:Transcriptional regulator n=1 Tax=Nippostrongylus brasiliensis TaxID=27835 RepID=A0A0N4Y9M1_NIPBR|nr:unnamed protein product [Nippostrongylus brasiliensis]
MTPWLIYFFVGDSASGKQVQQTGLSTEVHGADTILMRDQLLLFVHTVLSAAPVVSLDRLAMVFGAETRSGDEPTRPE